MGNYAGDKAHARFFGLKLNKNTDRELIERLDQQTSIQGYLKALIRNDIERGEKTMKKFIIKPEYLETFGPEANAYTVITEDDIERLASEWEMDPDEIWAMLIEDDSAKHCYKVLYRLPCEKANYNWENLNRLIQFDSGDPEPFFESEADFESSIREGFVTYDGYYATIWEDA